MKIPGASNTACDKKSDLRERLEAGLSRLRVLG